MSVTSGGTDALMMRPELRGVPKTLPAPVPAGGPQVRQPSDIGPMIYSR
ncbi:MAG: hypothetical protein LBV34_19040 [Nocardiopsaceae bacterium]|jgi:hypothetical protein|nr:hypothetical protein [Nocardiopsaceae bacterium]